MEDPTRELPPNKDLNLEGPDTRACNGTAAPGWVRQLLEQLEHRQLDTDHHGRPDDIRSHAAAGAGHR
jgi:hypothetical protein